MGEDGHSATRNPRCVAQPKEILQARCNPRLLVTNIVDFDLPTLQLQPLRSDLIQSMLSSGTCLKAGSS